VFDSHCHLAFDVFEGRVDQVVADAKSAGIAGMITVTTTTGNARANLAIAEQFDNVWCSAGVHPLHADEERDWSGLRAVAAHPRCVAFGELGLDNHYDRPPRAVQDQVLAEQLATLEAWKREGLVKPIILHCRKAYAELIAILRGTSFDPSRFVFHCFSGNPDEARLILDFGAWISFTGIVTFKNAPEVAEAAKIVPLDRMMVETDAPFLSPEPLRKVWPCEPKFMVHTARRMAAVRGMDSCALESILDENVQRFFGVRF
jgi:TatD DNase family protein